MMTGEGGTEGQLGVCVRRGADPPTRHRRLTLGGEDRVLRRRLREEGRGHEDTRGAHLPCFASMAPEGGVLREGRAKGEAVVVHACSGTSGGMSCACYTCVRRVQDVPPFVWCKIVRPRGFDLVADYAQATPAQLLERCSNRTQTKQKGGELVVS